MMKLKVGNKLKSEKLYPLYKLHFKNKQTRFIFSEMFALINKDSTKKVSVDQVYEIEKAIIYAETKADFKAVATSFQKLVDKKYKNVNGGAFGEFYFYIGQTSTYFRDLKKNKPNVFTPTNYIEVNSTKRDAYYKGLNTLKHADADFNIIVKKVLRKVL